MANLFSAKCLMRARKSKGAPGGKGAPCLTAYSIRPQEFSWQPMNAPRNIERPNATMRYAAQIQRNRAVLSIGTHLLLIESRGIHNCVTDFPIIVFGRIGLHI